MFSVNHHYPSHNMQLNIMLNAILIGGMGIVASIEIHNEAMSNPLDVMLSCQFAVCRFAQTTFGELTGHNTHHTYYEMNDDTFCICKNYMQQC